MGRTFRSFLVLIVLVVLLFLVGHLVGQDKRRKSIYKRLLGNALRSSIEKFKPYAVRRLKFRVNLFFAHETAIKNTPLDVLKSKVDSFKEAGVYGIDINMGLYPWLDKDEETIKKYDSLIEHIRKQKLQLVVSPVYSVVYHKIKDYDDWCRKATSVWVEIARRYKPDIFVVIHEPTTQNTRMGLKFTPKQWAEFVAKTAKKIKEVSHKTECGAGVLHTEYEYFKEFLKTEELKYISFDCYDLKGLKKVNEMIKEAKKANKIVYIEETWRPPHIPPKTAKNLDSYMAEGIGLAEFADIDCLWLELITIYASIWNMDAVTPFWTQTFFKYVEDNGNALSKDYNSKVFEAIKRGERTKTFHKLVELIKRYGWEEVWKEVVISDENRLVESIKLFMEDVGRLDPSPKGDYIVFDKRGVDRYYDVFIARLDGRIVRSLTDGVEGIPQKHNGCPVWHPSGKYILFQSEMEEHIGTSNFSEPGSGVWCNLWLITADGKKFWRLTDYPGDFQGKGALHPHFSPDGKRLIWAERVGNLEGAKKDWGEWVIKLAELTFDNKGNPHLENIKTYAPGEHKCFYETHGFSPDGSKIIFTSNPKKGQFVTDLDICTLDLETGKFTNLTDSPGVWDEHAHYSPDGKRIVWMSSEGYKYTQDTNKWRTKETDLRTELWIMNADGTDKKRLTYFNEEGHPEYLGDAIVGDNCWLPDGRTIAALVLDVRTFTPRIYLVKLRK